MPGFDRHEANKFAEVAAAVTLEFMEAREKILTEGAARGLFTIDGSGLDALLQAGQKARLKLTKEHGKIYDDERKRIQELKEFDLKVIVEQAKIANQLLHNALKRYEESVQHQLREQEINHETLVEQWNEVLAALELLQIQIRVTLQQYSNDIRSQVLALKVILDEAKIDLGLLVHLTRRQIEESAEIALANNEKADLLQVLAVEMAELQAVTTGLDGNVQTVMAQGEQNVIHQTTTFETLLIAKEG
jgi:hypothetical protein